MFSFRGRSTPPLWKGIALPPVQGDKDLHHLLDITILNVILGNADAHAKNFSLLHDPNGKISLAPAYDLMSTTYYPDTDRLLGMLINGKSDIKAVTRADLIDEASSWGLVRSSVEDRVADLLDRLPSATEQAAAEVEPPRDLVRLVLANTKRLANS